jgi:cytochrome c553
MKRSLRNSGVLALVAIVLTLAAWSAKADRIADIRNTKHNFSATVIPILPNGAQRNAAAASESQICAFCHTPHGATKAPKAPLWNRNLSKAT